MNESHGWKLLFHACVIQQLRSLATAAARAEAQGPEQAESNSNVKLFRALSRLMLDTVPQDPNRDEYRQGNTMGPDYRHWRRAKIGRRFRLFFRFDTRARIIIYAWVNDENTLRSSGGKNDPYSVFKRMLNRGNPPDEWTDLMTASQADWNDA